MTTLSPAAGELTTRITIEQIDTTTTDATGDPTHAWDATPLATLWAKIEDMSGAENWRAAMADPTAELKVTTHYTAGITTAMRVKIGSRYLGITHVANPDDRNFATVLTCKEGR